MPRHPVQKSLLLLGLLLCLGMLAGGCAVPFFHAEETISEIFKTGASPKIVVDTFNGSIDISNGKDDEVVVEVTKRASGFNEESAQDNLQHIDVSTEENGNEIRITVRRSGPTFGNTGASVVIAAPKHAQVELKTNNGYVVAEGMAGGVEARTTNGKIEIVEGRGMFDVSSTNGSIDIEATDAVVDAHSTNARIKFKGSLAQAEHKFKSTNGRIDVTLPEDSQFRFVASTSNGRVSCDFDYEKQGSKSRRSRSGTVGENPKTSLTLTTSNGSIDIRKAE